MLSSDLNLEGKVICKTCDGLTWIYPKDEKRARPCPECNQEAVERLREHYEREAREGPAFLDVPGPMF